MNIAREVAPHIGIAAACLGLGVARATFYRAQRPVSVQQTNVSRASSPQALSTLEQQTILEWLHEPAYADLSPRTVFAMLLDAGRYLASVSTFYRLLRASGETRGRRNELTHPAYAKPELLASGPRELWSWDITKLKGPAKWVCFHLYVILDVFSRYVIGWMMRRGSRPSSPTSSSPPPATRKASFAGNSPCMPTAAPRCAPSPWRFCSPISVSPEATAGRMSAMTIRTRKRSSRL